MPLALTVMTSCILCTYGYAPFHTLLDGRVYHAQCYERVTTNAETLHAWLRQLMGREAAAAESLRKASRVTSRILRAAVGKPDPSEPIATTLAAVRVQVRDAEIQLAKHRQVLTALHDVWPTYPPDWDDRREAVVRGSGNRCASCRRYHSILHVHHVLPLDRGGHHRADNLQPLCKPCHQKKHGGREFGARQQKTNNPFTDTVAELRQAIEQRLTVRFDYTKRDGQRGNRTISPTGFRTERRTLCVVGFCYLRRAERVFAVRRIASLQTVDRPHGA
jgi:hypothetical protein